MHFTQRGAFERRFGVSLNEPHTSMTALRMCVCMLLVCLDWPLLMNAFKHFTKIVCGDNILQFSYDNKSEGLCQTVASVWKWPGETSWMHFQHAWLDSGCLPFRCHAAVSLIAVSMIREATSHKWQNIWWRGSLQLFRTSSKRCAWMTS